MGRRVGEKVKREGGERGGWNKERGKEEKEGKRVGGRGEGREGRKTDREERKKRERDKRERERERERERKREGGEGRVGGRFHRPSPPIPKSHGRNIKSNLQTETNKQRDE